MNKSKPFSPKKTLIIVAILLPLILLSALGSALAGFEGLNPENHGKTLVFPVSDDVAYLIKNIFVYFVAPLSLLLVILAGLNLKFKNLYLNRSILITSLLLVFWLFFATWALDAKFVSTTNSSTQSQENSSESPNDGGLRVRSFDMN